MDATFAREKMDVVYVFSTAMAPYVERHRQPGTVLDMQDIDSEKWTTYAGQAGFPMRHVWLREGRTLLAYERAATAASDLTLLVTEAEVSRFTELAPETEGRVTWLEQGVDLARFDPALEFDTPFAMPGPHLVFTGNMDYWPNADAVTWFTDEIMPILRARTPAPQFHVVGANPGPGRARPGPAPGRARDRPGTRRAALCRARRRVGLAVADRARRAEQGAEAMAMARPVVVSAGAAAGVRARPEEELLVGDGAAGFAARISEVLDGRHPGLGAAARRAMEDRYGWDAVMARLDGLLASLPA